MHLETALDWVLFEAGVVAFSFIVAVVVLAIRDARAHGWRNAMCFFWACEPDESMWADINCRCVRCGRRLFP